MELKRTSEITLSNLRVLIYGNPGTGKTLMASTFERPIFHDIDRGMLSLRNKDIPYYDYSDMNPSVIWPLLISNIKKDLVNEKVGTIVVDSLTTAGEIAMSYVQFMNKTANLTPNLQDWAHQVIKIKELISLLTSSNKHIVCTAHEKMEKDELTGRIWCGPFLTGRLAKSAGVYFDEVYHLEVVDTKDSLEFRAVIKPNGIYTAKSRVLNRNKVKWIKPDFSTILSLSSSEGT